MATRTRIRPELRRQQIIEATHRVTLERGLHDVRMQDVADELHVSSGLIHYHFATKDELIEAMLRDTAEREVAGVEAALRRVTSAEEKLAALIEIYLPSIKRDPSWVMWIDAWGEALRDATVRRISEELDAAWVDLMTAVIAEGVDTGVFASDDPGASAWRLCAVLDGLGLQVVLHQGTMTRAQMHDHVRRAARTELDYELARAT
ncbi:MAG: TetR/AcrR family transcriptional regulator [Ilumatobacteraceae bacterium]